MAASVQGSINLEDPRYDWQACTSPFTYNGLVEGHWTVSVKAYDYADQPSRQIELDVWVDTIAPVVNITVGPDTNGVNPGGRVVFTLVDMTEMAAPGSGSPIQWQGLLQTNSDKGGGGSQTNGTQDKSSTEGTLGATTETYAVNIRSSYRIEATTVELGKSALGVWSNCSDDCVYSGLSGGTYSFQARGIDAAGNLGNASQPTYTFQLEGSTSGLPMWAMIAIIVGSVVAGIAGILLLWWCCCKSRTTKSRPNTLPNGAIPSSNIPMNGYNGVMGMSPPPPYLVGGANSINGYGSITNGYHHTNGNSNGYVGHSMQQPQMANDPIEAQQIALALAASQRDSQTSQRGLRQSSSTNRSRVDEEEAQLRAAMAASLEEERRRARGGDRVTDDAELRAAIEASLAEQQRRGGSQLRSTNNNWPPSAPAPSQFSVNPYGSTEEWPPRR